MMRSMATIPAIITASSDGTTEPADGSVACQPPIWCERMDTGQAYASATYCAYGLLNMLTKIVFIYLKAFILAYELEAQHSGKKTISAW